MARSVDEVYALIEQLRSKCFSPAQREVAELRVRGHGCAVLSLLLMCVPRLTPLVRLFAAPGIRGTTRPQRAHEQLGPGVLG